VNAAIDVSLHGVPRSVPPLPRYYKALRLPAAPPALLRCLRFAVPPPRLELRSRRRKAPRLRAWGCSPDSPKPLLATETTGPPRFLEDPTMNVPCSPTPAGPLRSATAALWCCLPPNGRRRLPRQILISRLNHTARSLTVYASQSGLLHRHARLASGWLAGLSGRGCLPAGSQRKVSDLLILLSQASPGAPISPYRNHNCQLVQRSRLLSGFCSSACAFAPCFFRTTQPRGWSRPCASLTFTSIRLVGTFTPCRTCSAHNENGRWASPTGRLFNR
jgi:hypothetical protein